MSVAPDHYSLIRNALIGIVTLLAATVSSSATPQAAPVPRALSNVPQETYYYDEKTRLIWLKTNDQSYKIHKEAISYCNEKNKGAKTQWKLPTLEQLKELYEGLPQNRAGNLFKGFIWSSIEAPPRSRFIEMFYAADLSRGIDMSVPALSQQYTTCVLPSGFDVSGHYVDQATGLTWSATSDEPLSMYKATPHCFKYNKHVDFDEWKLPSLAQAIDFYANVVKPNSAMFERNKWKLGQIWGVDSGNGYYKVDQNGDYNYLPGNAYAVCITSGFDQFGNYIDRKNGLIWSIDKARPVDFNTASNICESQSRRQWQLPSLAQLESFYKYLNENEKRNMEQLADKKWPLDFVWSSTKDGHQHAVLSLKNGVGTKSDDTATHYGMCVRPAKPTAQIFH